MDSPSERWHHSRGTGMGGRTLIEDAGRRGAGGVVILADASAWLEYDRATGSDVDVRVTELMTGGLTDPRAT